MVIEFSSMVLDALLREAESAHPQECCGLLLGRGGAIEAMQVARNVHPDPATHFEIDPAALIAAYRDERAGGPSLIGFYHSHPNGVARPSATDAACAAGDGRLWAIIADGEVALWRDQPGGFAPLSYERDKR